MNTGLGLRVIPNDSLEEIKKAVPIANEAMVTADEGRLHTSQVSVADADLLLRAVPFKDEVILLGAGSAQGLTEYAKIKMITAFTHTSIVSKNGREAIVSDIADKGTVSLLNTATDAILGTLTPASHVTGNKFGQIIAASHDLGVVAVSNSAKAFSIFVRSGDSFTEVLAVAGATVQVSALAVSGDGRTVAIGYADKSNLKGEVKLYRITGNTTALYQATSSATALDSELFGCSLSLSENGLVLAVGAKGSHSNKGAVIVMLDNGTSFSELQKLSIPDALGGNQAGASVELSNDASILAFGATGRTYSASTPQFNSGAVFIANKLQSGLFQIDQELQSSSSGDDGGLGLTLALSGNGKTLLSGAWQSDTFGSAAGAVIAFVKSGSDFVEVNSLSLDGVNSSAKLGQSLSIDHKGLVVVIGSNKGIMLADSISNWQKSIPEVSDTDISEGSNKQGSTSGLAIKKAIVNEVAKIHEVSTENIRSGDKTGGKVSGETLSIELNRLEATLSGTPANIHSAGITELHHEVNSGTAPLTINEADNSASIDQNTGGSGRIFIDEEFIGDWSIELLISESLNNNSGATLLIDLGTEQVYLNFASTNLNSLHENSAGYEHASHWNDFDRTAPEPLLIGFEWLSPDSAKLMLARKNNRYSERVITFAAPVNDRKSTLSIQFGIQSE
jgi:hypothetical protein